MPVHGFPSTEFPGLSAFTVQVPDGWEADLAAGLEFVVRRPMPAGVFVPNLIGSVRRMRAGALPAGIAELDQRASRLTDYAELGRSEEELDGKPAFHAEFSYRHSDELTVAQMITLVAVELDQVADLVQLTATCAGDQVREVWQDLRAMHRSVTVTPYAP